MRVMLRYGQVIVLEIEIHHRGISLGVGVGDGMQTRVVGQGKVDGGGGLHRNGHDAKDALHLALDEGCVDVAHNHQCLVVGAIPAVVELA